MRPDLPDYGVYLYWPEPGIDWICDTDRELAEQWIPSNRVFKRESFDGEYYCLRYGDRTLRVRPTLWLRVVAEPIEVGDQVEVLTHFGKNEARIGRIVEKRFEKREQRIVYHVLHRDHVVPQTYDLSDLHLLTTRPQLRASEMNHPAPTLEIQDHADYLPFEEE